MYKGVAASAHHIVQARLLACRARKYAIPCRVYIALESNGANPNCPIWESPTGQIARTANANRNWWTAVSDSPPIIFCRARNAAAPTPPLSGEVSLGVATGTSLRFGTGSCFALGGVHRHSGQPNMPPIAPVGANSALRTLAEVMAIPPVAQTNLPQGRKVPGATE